jgi:hypothetical protein
MAISKSNVKLTKLILDYNPKLSLSDNKNRTPIDLI